MREITKSLPKSANEVFAIELCGTSYCDSGYKMKRANSPSHRFAYIISGKGTVVTKSGRKKVEACDVLYLPYGEEHNYYADDREPWTMIWFNVNGSLVESLVEVYGIKDTRVFKNCRIFSLFDEFNKNVNSILGNSNVEYDNAVILHKIITEMVICNKIEKDGAPDDATVLREYIDNNYSKTIKNSDLAKLIGRSESQTIRIFKKAFSKTPYDYALERKMYVAKQMLKSTSMSVRDIAMALGFTNEHYFSSCFKQHEGVTPLKHRKG